MQHLHLRMLYESEPRPVGIAGGYSLILGVSGLLFAPKLSLTRSIFEFLTCLASAKTAWTTRD